MEMWTKERKLFAAKWIFIVGRAIQTSMQLWLVYIAIQSNEASLAAPIFYVIIHALIIAIFALTFYFIILVPDRSMKTMEFWAAVILFFIHLVYLAILAIEMHPSLTLKKHPDHDKYEIKTNLGTLTIILELPLVVCVNILKKLTWERGEVCQDIELNNAAPIQLIQRVRYHLQNYGASGPAMVAELMELSHVIHNIIDSEENQPISLPPEDAQIQNLDVHPPLNNEPEEAVNVRESIPSINILEQESEEENLYLPASDGEEHSLKINNHEVGSDNHAFEHESREKTASSNGHNIDQTNGDPECVVPIEDANLHLNGDQEISIQLPGHKFENEEDKNKLQKRQPSPNLSVEIV